MVGVVTASSPPPPGDNGPDGLSLHSRVPANLRHVRTGFAGCAAPPALRRSSRWTSSTSRPRAGRRSNRSWRGCARHARESEHRLGDSMLLAGDAGDVGEYLDEQREQQLLDRRIELLDERLATAQTIEPAHAARGRGDRHRNRRRGSRHRRAEPLRARQLRRVEPGARTPLGRVAGRTGARRPPARATPSRC